MGMLHRLGKKAFFGRFQKPWRWPEGVPRESWEPVRFASLNGAQLAGLFGAGQAPHAGGAVVLAHPMGLAAKGFWLKHGHAQLLRRAGFDVLAFDFNGFGESESADFDYPGDLLAAGDYVRGRLPGGSVGVLGASFGAGYALCAMARGGHPFRAAVLEASFPSLPYFWRRYPALHALLRLSQFLYPRMERELRPILAATKLKGAPTVLLVHGEADSVAPVSVGVQLREAMQCCASAELWTVPGADHTLGLRAAPEEYAHRVTALFQRALATRPPGRSSPASAASSRDGGGGFRADRTDAGG
jgi:uncharacterized protein